MIRKFTLLFSAFLGLVLSSVSAQGCLYQLQFFDSVGDGWNGATLTAHINGTPTTYGFVPTVENGGAFLSIFIEVQTGDSISLDFQSGVFPEEESFIVLDNDDQLVYASSNPPENGTDIFNFIVECKTCVSPPAESVDFFRLRSTSVDVIWNSTGTLENPTYLLEYGLAGFTPGVDEIELIETTDTSIRVQPLTDTTLYEFYLSVLCPTDSMTVDTSIARGPFEVFTPLSTDVGISAIINPTNGCELGSQPIRVEIANFGGQPLTFIPFDYSINGQSSGLSMPEDGFFVGVVGAGESEITEFDIQGNFTAPGSYIIEVWTALSGDQDMSNDTISIEIVNAPFISDLPYDEEFEINDGFFTPERAGLGENSWAYGSPNGNSISGAGSGENAWVTNLNGNYNATELSYLTTPCLDFTEATDDYAISFLYNLDMPLFDSDGVFVEVTTDDESWVRLGDFGTGINWYNDAFGQYWDGSTAGTWVTALHPIGEFAGEELVRFRFVLTSDLFTQGEGFAFDNVYIGPRGALDLAASNIEVIQMQPCGSPNDVVSLSFTNLGLSAITDYTLNYQVNGGDIISEPLSLILEPGGSGTYEFATTFDGAQDASLEVLAWVSLEGDDIAQNDTISTTVNNSRQIPIYEDFESGLPADWQIEPFTTFVAQDHGSPTTVMYTNLFGGNPLERIVTANYGPVEMGDSLAFDYRFVDFIDGSGVALQGDEVRILIVENCAMEEESIGVINFFTHTPSISLARRAFSLDAFAGSDIQIVFEASWEQGNYFFDLDNVNVKRCPETFDIQATVTDASTSSTSDGAVEILFDAGIAPYTFEWSNGAATQNLSEVPPGDYTLTITDVQGCSDEIEVRVDFISSIDELTNFGRVIASPNPTSGQLSLRVELIQPQLLEVDLLDQFGRRIKSKSYGRVDQLQEGLDLRDLPAGIYFVRLTAGNQVHTIRVVKVR
ncbi:MAG: T9SS type A sorting domain-containing protein [Bacteroidota bacterium]